jgi:hypothetical protein
MKLLLKILVLSLFLSLTTLASTGCTIGIKEKNNLIFVSPVPIPEVSKGSVIVATNKPIALAIIDEKDKIFYQNVGGYVLVDPYFYEMLIKAYNGDQE